MRSLRCAQTEKARPSARVQRISQVAPGAWGGEAISMESPAPKRPVNAVIAAVAVGASSLAGSQAHIGEGSRSASRNSW